MTQKHPLKSTALYRFSTFYLPKGERPDTIYGLVFSTAAALFLVGIALLGLLILSMAMFGLVLAIFSGPQLISLMGLDNSMREMMGDFIKSLATGHLIGMGLLFGSLLIISAKTLKKVCVVDEPGARAWSYLKTLHDLSHRCQLGSGRKPQDRL